MAKKTKTPAGDWSNISLRIKSDEARAIRETATKLGLQHQATIRLAIEKGLPLLLKALGKGAK